jgi:phosphate transport system substrate-binding protein
MNRLTVALVLAAAGGLAGTATAAPIQINGAGATFPNPIYSKWFSEYNKLHPDIQINYQPIGSGGGIRQLTNQTVFFGATDGPMTNDQIQAAGAKVLHLPTVLGAVVPIYEVPGVSTPLKFSGPLLADIFLGKVTKWNDAAITAENPGVSRPGSEITVVHRSDGSGTSYIWADYLAKVSPEWSKRVGVATAVNWPVGVGGKGNEGVAGLVKQTPNSIGYVELIYALQNKIPYGAVKNASGEYVRASIDAVTAAAAATEGKMPPDFRERAGQRRLSGRVLHLAAPVREQQGQGAGQGHGGFREVGPRRRTALRERPRICALARQRREDGAGGAGPHQVRRVYAPLTCRKLAVNARHLRFET